MTPEEAAVARRVNEAINTYALADTASAPEDTAPVSMRRRRGFDARDYADLATLSLVRDDGMLRWDYRPADDRPAKRRARRGVATTIGAEVLSSFSFKETPPNQVIAALEELDKKLTPDQGLRILKNGKLQKVEDPQTLAINGPVLLLVHGTFSKSDMFVDEFAATAPQNDFLGRAASKYKAVLAFDHPTLSVSPWINALDLEHALARVSGPIDVICHSRGGLVVAWWLRNAKREVRKVIFVGAPLEGTSLASPARLRAALDLMANMIKALEAGSALASTVLPFMGAAAGLAKILGGILQFGASTPLADAAIAIVPGLASQSRVGNNAELLRLTRLGWASTPVFHAVRSNFEPTAGDTVWQFWKRFRPIALADSATDLIFEGKNDLVVDTDSMTLVCGAQIDKLCDFKTSPDVHHCNYFRQKKTVDFLADTLL